jgi:carboxyl-terminal processing protease
MKREFILIKKTSRKLSAYRLRLDEEIKQKQSDFLKLVTALYTTRLHQADTMIDAIARKTL